MRIAVIGGGLSGLTAAYYLHQQRPAATIHLYEASPRIGGVIQTERRDGWLIEHGADCFSTNPDDALRLCGDLGIADRLIAPQLQRRRAMVARGDQVYAVPEGFVLMRPTRWWPVLRSPILSWRGKLRLAMERTVRPRQGGDDESLASFVRRRLGREAHERLVQPLVAGIYTADAEQLSMQATMPQFVALEREFGSLTGGRRRGRGTAPIELERSSSGARYGQFRVFPEGMGYLMESLAAALPAGTIRLESPVASIEPTEENRWRVDRQDALYDALLLALPAPRMAPLLRGVAPQTASELEQIEFASSAIVLLGVPSAQIERLPDAFGFVVPAVEQRRILAASFADHKFPGRTPPGHSLIRVFIGGAVQPHLLAHSDAELIRIASEELESLIGLRGPLALAAVQRWDRAMPQYKVGHLQRVERIEREIAGLSGVEIAGNALRGVGIAAVVGTARRAAERLLASTNRLNLAGPAAEPRP